MKRRDFLKTSVVAGVALSLNFEGLQAALSSNTVAVEQAPDLDSSNRAVTGSHARQSLRSAWRHRQIYQKKGRKSLLSPISAGTVHRNWPVIPILN